MSNLGRTGQENHVEVVSSHEVDVHVLPNTSLVDVPANRTGYPLDGDIPRTRADGVGIGANINGCDSQKSQYGGEHFGSLSFTAIVPKKASVNR